MEYLQIKYSPKEFRWSKSGENGNHYDGPKDAVHCILLLTILPVMYTIAMEISWIISISISGIVAIVGIFFISDILSRRYGDKNEGTIGNICIIIVILTAHSMERLVDF